MSVPALLGLVAGGLLAAAVLDLLPAASAGRRRVRLRLPALVLGTLARLGRHSGAPPAPAGLAERLAAAGLAERTTPREIMAAKAGGALVAAAAMAPVASALPGRLAALVLAAAPAAAFVAPDAILRRRMRDRARRAEAELPDVLDLLRVALEAGLPLARALGEVGRRHPGLLAHELRRSAAEIGLGRAREDALRRLAGRCPAPSVPAVVALLVRGEQLGAPLGPALAAQAAELRAAQSRTALEAAAKAAPKVQLVVAGLLVPAVLLLVAAGLVDALLPAT